MKAPTKHLLASWVKKAWEPVSTDLITKSFKFCAISNAIDNSENNRIKVIHKDEVLFPKRDELLQKLEELSSIDNDVLTNLENPYQPDPEQDDVNQIVIDDDC